MSIHSTRPALPPVAELAALVRSGATLADVGAMYGASARSVQSRLNGAGYERTGEVQTAKRPSPRPAPRTLINLMPADTQAVCVAWPEVFSAAIDGSRWAVREAKAICATCPAVEDCLRVNGRDFELGVVGGFTDAERKAHFKASA